MHSKTFHHGWDLAVWQNIMTTINLYDNNEPFATTRVTFIYDSSNKLGREYVYANIPEWV